MEDWKECTIGDICSKITSGGTPKSTNASFYNGNIPWLNTKEVNFNRIFTTEKTITQAGYDNSSAKWIPENSVIVAMYGATAGKSAISKIPLTTNQACCNLIVNKEITDYNFLYYYLFNSYNHLASLANGGAQQNLNANQIREYPINLPPLPTQQKIAQILSSLDDKIELNNKINDNLEQQAQALFKSWFVDFEPFGGEMPAGWKVGKLGEFVEIKRGGSPRPIQNFMADEGLRWLKISDVTSLSAPFVLNIAEYIKEEGLSKTVFLKAGSLVLSNSATPGIPKILDLDTCIHDGWLYFPKSQLSNEYLYLLFKEIRPQLVNLGNGSIFTNLKTDILKNFEVNLPTQEILEKFQNIVKPMFDKMLEKQRETKQLETIRDTLLPKLMNGEIEI